MKRLTSRRYVVPVLLSAGFLAYILLVPDGSTLQPHPERSPRSVEGTPRANALASTQDGGKRGMPKSGAVREKKERSRASS